MTTIVNTHIGLNRGKKRIFIEGSKLVREGYRPGMRFNLSVKDDKLCLTIDDDGKYKISRRKNRSSGLELPVIDITSREMAELFEENEEIRVLIKQGRMIVSTSHLADNQERREQRLLDKLASGKPLKVCSVFHGGGVLDKSIHHGLLKSGIKSKVAIAIEKESKYLDSSIRNNPELWSAQSILIESPIQAINLQSSKQEHELDLWIGGIPCVGASISGKSKCKIANAEDHPEAGAMFFYSLQTIVQLNPSVCIIENVPLYQNTASMSVIRSVLDSAGYHVQERVLNSANFDTIEKRERLVVVAVSKGIEGFDINDVELDSNEWGERKTLADILEDIPADSPKWRSYDYLEAKMSRDIEAGKGFRRQLLTGSESHCGCIGRLYAKARTTEPFIQHPQDKSLSRLLTPTEHARVKNCPEQLISNNSDTVSHEILGQGVAYSVFHSLGSCLGRKLRNWMSNKLNVVPLQRCA